MEEQLIDAVRMHPCIYNKVSLEYRNKSKKEKAWRTVANSLGVKVEQCQGRWRSLRDRYVRESGRKLPLENDVEVKPKWKHMERLSFLHEHLAPRKCSPWKIQLEQKHIDLDEDEEEPNKKLDANTYDETFAFVDSVGDYLVPKSEPAPTSNNPTHMTHPHINPYIDENAFGHTAIPNNLLEKIEDFLNATKNRNDGIFSSIGEFIDKVPANKRLAYKMDVLNYAFNRYNEIVDDV